MAGNSMPLDSQLSALSPKLHHMFSRRGEDYQASELLREKPQICPTARWVRNQEVEMPDISHLFTTFLAKEAGNTLPSEGTQVIQLIKKGNMVWISLYKDV